VQQHHRRSVALVLNSKRDTVAHLDPPHDLELARGALDDAAADPCYGKDVARVTSKLQVTIPKAIASRYRISPGDEIEWLPAGDAIRVVPSGEQDRRPNHERRLALFDRATERQRLRQCGKSPSGDADRGWRRDDLYTRGRTR